MVLTKDNRVKGSTIKFDIASNGKNCVMYSSLLLFGSNLNFRIPLAIPSRIFQTNKKPKANAERLTKIPKNKQNEKEANEFYKISHEIINV